MNRKTFLLSMAGGAACAPLVTGCKTRPGIGTASSPPSNEEQFAGRILADTNAAYFVAVAYIGDRLGLSKRLAAGPHTGQELALGCGLSERYVLEWLRAMTAAAYIHYDPSSGRFEMPREHAAVLVDENSPVFSAGLIEVTVPDIIMVPRVMAAFRTGNGIPYGDYPPETFDGIERLTKPDYLHRLAEQWVRSVPDIAGRLGSGGSAADLGCGAGHALIGIAKSFPLSKGAGFDPYEPSVVRARKNATAAGLADRLSFATFDGVHVPGGPYDLITMCHSLHHAGDPVALLRSARQALAPDGVLFVVEERRSDQLEDDINTPRAGYYGSGLLECMPAALAEGGPGFGTGITERELRALGGHAGFASITRVLHDDPLLSFFVLRA